MLCLHRVEHRLAGGAEEAADDEAAAGEEAVADGINSLHEGGVTDAVAESDCGEHESLVGAVDQARGELSCQRKWVMRQVSGMLQLAKAVLVHYRSYRVRPRDSYPRRLLLLIC